MKQFIETYRGIINYTTYGAAMIAGICILATAGIIVFEIIMRGIFKTPTDWVLETSVYLILTAGFLGLPVAYRENAHVRVTFLVDKLSKVTQLKIDGFTTVLSILFFLVFMTESTDVITESLELSRVSPSTLQFSLFIPQAMLVVGSFLLLTKLALHLLEIINYFRKRRQAIIQLI